MAKSSSKSQNAYLYDMLEAARLIRTYVDGVPLDAFLLNSEKRDAVALRLSVLGESANKLLPQTENVLPSIPFKHIRGLRNRIAHDYGAVDFPLIWEIAQREIPPLITILEAHLQSAAS